MVAKKKCKLVFSRGAMKLIAEHKAEGLLIKFFELCEVKIITYSRITTHLAI